MALLAALLMGLTSCAVPEAKTTSLLGAVLEAASDPRRQRPLANAEISLTTGTETSETKSDASGLFRLTLAPPAKRGQVVTLKVQHAGYESFEETGLIKDQLYIVRLKYLHPELAANESASAVTLGDLRVRYSVKTSATIDVGSFAKTFEVSGRDSAPCQSAGPCSPDGKWQAAAGSASYDAGDGNRFQEVRVSCIAGPCPFTSIERPALANSDRTMKISALDWSDTATFLVEAEVTRTQIDQAVRYSIPVVFGSGMNFALPGSAEGPSVEADVNGTEIVFPLGPNLYLSWATCTVKTDESGSKLYRCELKPGYQFH